MASWITLHSTWRGVLVGPIFGLLISGLGVFSVVRTGGALGSLVLLGVGVMLLAVGLLDFPVSTTFDASGVTRRPVLRRHRIEWARVDQLTRTRPGLVARARSLAPGGLVAKVGRRRYLLVDQCESLDEYQRLEKLLGDQARDVLFEDLIVPPEGVDPTWVYRRSRWGQDEA